MVYTSPPNIHALSDPEDNLYEVNYNPPIQRNFGLTISSFRTGSQKDFEDELNRGVNDVRKEGRGVFVSFMDFGRNPMLRLAGNLGVMGVKFFDYLGRNDWLDFRKSEFLGLLKKVLR